MDEITSLRQENHALQAKIQGLQYENQMYKQLMDNIFLKNSEPSGNLFQGQPKVDDSIYAGNGNTSFQYHQANASNVKTEEETYHYTQPGAEIFNACEIDADYDLDYEYEEDTKYSMEQKRKIAKQLEEEEEIEPVVENPDLIKKEMEALFGTEKADEILAMETAMQLNFEKARDSYKAQLWPCLPLNMKFK